MRTPPDKRLEKWRIRTGLLASTDEIGNNGAFFIRILNRGNTTVLKVIASVGGIDNTRKIL